MPKQIKELRRFINGTKSSASDTDILEEAAIYSKNIDPLSEEGKLKGNREHIKILPSEGTLIYKVYPTPAPSGYTDWPENWTSNLDDAAAADLHKDSVGNYYFGYDAKIILNHKGLGIANYVMNVPVPLYPAGSETDAELLREQNDLMYKTVKSTLEAFVRPGMTVSLVRGVMGLGTTYPYPLEGTTEFVVTDEDTGDGDERFIADTTYDGTTYLAGTLVPDFLMPPFRAFEIQFSTTYTDTESVEWEVRNMTVFVESPDNADGTATKEYHLDTVYLNPENEVLQTGVAASSYYPLQDKTEYLNINATEMEFALSEGKHNLAFYSITEDDISHPGYDSDADTGAATTYRMKVIEDFYGDRFLVDSNSQAGDQDYFDLPSEPKDVSLTKKNADVYIGTGNTETTKSKWFGKIDHKQFNHTLDQYRLEDAEIYPLDDGETVFNLLQVGYNRHGTATGQAITTDRIYGIADGQMHIFGIDNQDTTDPDSDTNPNLGKQFKDSNSLIFSPSAIAPSKWAYEENRTISDAKWNIDNQDIWLENHTHNANFAYWWAGDKYKDGIRMVKTEFDLTGPTIEAETFTLPIDLQFDIPPPSGARVSDIIETYDPNAATDDKYRVWVLYTNKDFTPFTWDQEFVYSFKVSEIVWNGAHAPAKSHTPPALKMKREQAWSGGAGSGRSVYVDGNTHKMDFDHFPYVCHEGTWSCRQNKFYYRKCDDMGGTEGQVWNSLNARHWDRTSSYGEWDLGYNCGFSESSDYEITPHRFGLIDLEDEHRVGMLANLKAKFVSDAGKLNTQRVSPNRNWPDRKYNIYPSRGSETEDYDEIMMFFLDYEHKGTKHRRIADGLINVIGGSQDEGDTFAYRYSNYITHASDDKINMMAQGFENSTAETTYAGYSDINQMPDSISKVIYFSKFLWSSTAYNPIFFVSVQGNSSNATTLQKYSYDYPQRTGTSPLQKKFSVGAHSGNDHTPMIFEDIGCAAFAHYDPQPGTNHEFFFSPRMGTYINARGIWTAAAGWTTPSGLSSGEVGDEYLDTYIKYHEHSELPYGITIMDGDLSQGDNHNFAQGATYYYKMSVLFDGYQESPITTFYFAYIPDENSDTAVMTVKLDQPHIRATHVVIYRKNNVEDFYRMVTEIDLSEGWGKSGDSWFKVEIDNGILGATYEAITGMPESLRDTSINYTISTTAGGYLFIGNCYHKEIKNGQNFIFRSQPGNFGIFNWSRDFLILANEPTAMAYWAGRLYIFDKSNMYRIDPNTLVTEDEHAGVGCFGEQSYIVTDFGLYFCDANNMYMHNGSKVQAIGTDVLKNSKYDELGPSETKKNWHNINHAYDPYVAYDAFNQTVMFMWEDLNGEKGSWNFNIPRNRWDLVDIPNPKAFAQGKHGERFLSDGTYLYELNESQTKANWTHHSPSIDFGYSTIDKKIKKIKLIFNNASDLASAKFTMNIYSDDVLLYTVTHPTHTSGAPDNKRFKDEEHEREYKIPTNKTKKLRFELVDSNVEIDSIGITYTTRKVD